MSEVSWSLVAVFGSTGLVMAMLSCLVGMRQKVEIPLWWVNYAIWIVVVLVRDVPAPFLTIVIASVVAGIVHGVMQAILLSSYKVNNPWYADQMKGRESVLRGQFIVMGIVIGTVFGALVGGIAWGLDRFI